MEGPPSAKRPRLSLACDECRRRKVKCDADYPKCRHCRNRNSDCITTDPKHPDMVVVREWIEANQKVKLDVPSEDQPVAQAAAGTPSTWQAAPIQDGRQQTIEVVPPVYQPHDMFFNRDAGTHRMKMMGSSSSACLTQSLNLYLNRVGLNSVSSHFKHGMRHAEEFDIPLDVNLPGLQDVENRDSYVESYFDRIHRLYPLYDIDATKRTITQFASVSNYRALPRDQIPLLVSAYLIISLGADDTAHGPTEEGETFLRAAASLVGHILLVPYLSSVQALLLLSIAYRGRNKDGMGWQMVGLAVRIAHTIGLHKHSVRQPSKNHAVTHKPEKLFHARIWAICCCLEKTMQLESGRPSAIDMVDRDQMMGPEQRPPGLDYLQWHMGLAGYQSQICDHIYNHQPGDRSSRQILLDTARLDKALVDWSNQLPPDFHPGGDLFRPDDDFHIAAHLSIQYHQTMIALHRAPLIAPAAIFDAEIEDQCSDEPSKARLKSGESICVKSARSIARLTIELSERKIESRLLTCGPALLACIVLAMFLAKHPYARMVASDLELLKATADIVKEQYLRSGQDKRFAEGSMNIYHEVKRYLDIAQKRHRTPPSSHARPTGRQTQSTNTLEAGRRSGMPSEHDAPRTPRSERAPPAYSDVTPSVLAPRDDNFLVPTLRQDSQAQELAQGTENDSSWQIVGDNNMALENSHWDEASVGGSILNAASEGIGPLPFDDYNVVELWNWMLYVDANPSPMDSLSSQNWTGP